MKVLFLSIFIFLFFGCINQETFEVQTSNSDEVLIIDEKTKLVRTFENDYSLWKIKITKIYTRTCLQT